MLKVERKREDDISRKCVAGGTTPPHKIWGYISTGIELAEKTRKNWRPLAGRLSPPLNVGGAYYHCTRTPLALLTPDREQFACNADNLVSPSVWISAQGVSAISPSSPKQQPSLHLTMSWLGIAEKRRVEEGNKKTVSPKNSGCISMSKNW